MAAQGSNNLQVVDRAPAARRKKRRGITKDPELMQKVALAKFPLTGESRFRRDREVAKIVGISVQAVGDLVEAAFKAPLLSTVHHSSFEVIELAHLFGYTARPERDAGPPGARHRERNSFKAAPSGVIRSMAGASLPTLLQSDSR